MKKIVVAHPFKQHSIRLSEALYKSNYLYMFITNVYDKDSSIYMRIIRKALGKNNLKRLQNHSSKILPDDKVLLLYQFQGLICTFLGRIKFFKPVYKWLCNRLTRRFGIAVAKYVIRNNIDIIVMYDTLAKDCFEYLDKHNAKVIKILDMSSVNQVFFKKIYDKDLKLAPEFANSLVTYNSIGDEKFLDDCLKEIELADYFLSPSSFVTKSLLYSKIKEDKIFKCPYGCNFKPSNKYIKHKGNHLQLIYVGTVSERKGISWLLKAMKQFSRKDVQLLLVGEVADDKIFEQYNSEARFIGRVTHDVVRTLLKESDVFVFPSLGEGLSLSALEAMGMGLPCILSENSGANDFIINGENGFVVPIQDSSSIVETIKWFLKNKNQMNEMSKRMIQISSNITWENYDRLIAKSFHDIIEINK